MKRILLFTCILWFSLQTFADTIWSGSVVMPASWGVWQTISPTKFAQVEVGDMLRLYASDVHSGAQGRICTGSWGDMPDAPIVAIGGRYFQYSVTSDMLAELQANGMIVCGCNYTLTAVRNIKAADLVNYQPSIVIEQPDWTWTETQPNLNIIVSNPKTDAASIIVEVEVTTDKGEAVKTYAENVTLAASESCQAVSFSLNDIITPGIYKLTAYVNDDVVSYTRPEDHAYTWSTLNIAYQPEQIVSLPDAQEDFAEFWTATKEQLAAIPMNAQLTLVESGSHRDLYTVTLQSIPNGLSGDPVLIRGYYAEPKGDGNFPCIINYQGYDSDDTSGVWHPTADSNPGYAELIISARGQSFGNRGANKSDNIYCTTTETTENIANGKWFTWNFGNKETYYYRGAYMDQVRGIDFICSREKVDKNNIFCTGGSQGGAFTLVAAALSDGRVNAIAPAIQFMGDFPDYFQVGQWPAYEAGLACQKAGMTNEQMYAFLSYFDTKNFASMISAPTLSSIGLQDNVCPAHTNLAPFNLLTCEKQLYVNKNLVHEVPNKNAWSTPNNKVRDWTSLCTAWWKSHMKSGQGICEVKPTVRTGNKIILRGEQFVIVHDEKEYTIWGTNR